MFIVILYGDMQTNLYQASLWTIFCLELFIDKLRKPLKENIILYHMKYMNHNDSGFDATKIDLSRCVLYWIICYCKSGYSN